MVYILFKCWLLGVYIDYESILFKCWLLGVYIDYERKKFLFKL